MVRTNDRDYRCPSWNCCEIRNVVSRNVETRSRLTGWYLSSDMGRQQDNGILWLKNERGCFCYHLSILCSQLVSQPGYNKTDDRNPDGVGAS